MTERAASATLITAHVGRVYCGRMRVVLVILALTSSGCWIDSTTQTATDGSLDLTSWDFDQAGSVALDGGWAFYWGRLADGTHPLDGVPDAYRRPRAWNSDGAYPA